MGGGAKLIGLIRDRGIAGALSAVAAYLRSNLFRYELDGYIAFRRRPPVSDPSVARGYGLQFAAVELGSPQTVDALVRAWPTEWRAGSSDETIRRTIERELSSGDECYAYWDGERIAAASWVGFRNSPYLKKFAKAFGLAQDEALRRTTFVVPEYRGRRLQVLLAAEVENHVSQTRGISRFIVYVGIRNTASLRNLLKVYEESRPVYHVRLTIMGKTIDWFPNRDQLPWIKMQEKGNDSQG
jgi:GNAT superfamily N-acetyltransferase